MALRLVDSLTRGNWIFHSIVGRNSTQALSEAKGAGAQELALNKARVEEALAVRAKFNLNRDTSSQEVNGELQLIQAELAGLTGPMMNLPMAEARRRGLQTRLRQLEGDLAKNSALVAQTIRERNISLADIAHAIPGNAVLLDFVHYREIDFHAATNCWQGLHYACYLTFPLQRGSTSVLVERVELGEAQSIDNAVTTFVRRMAAGQYRARDLLTAEESLSNLVYAPLRRFVEKASHLIICPDGELSRLPFEMLRDGGRLLIEEKLISYVGSGREIVRLDGRGGREPTGAPFVVGNPEFDLNLAEVDSSSCQVAGKPNPSVHGFEVAIPKSLSRSFRAEKFHPLPSAAKEAHLVAQILGGDSVLRLGEGARECELRSLQSPRVLHLATHGFYLSDQEQKSGLTILERFASDRNRSALRPDDWESPLSRCGLALAGANHAMQATNSVEDGLLTGQEAALLNLQGTELVILSACDTGTGEVKIGEGVMSLRRAFRIAGAETVLASHWPVSDLATRALMTEFVRRWRSGEPRAKAWREAQLSLLNSKDLSSPYFWAAFTLTGRWD